MKKIIVTLSAISLSMAGLSGCANMNETQRDTGMGAAIGAVAGGLIGAATAGGNKVSVSIPAKTPLLNTWARLIYSPLLLSILIPNQELLLF